MSAKTPWKAALDSETSIQGALGVHFLDPGPSLGGPGAPGGPNQLHVCVSCDFAPRTSAKKESILDPFWRQRSPKRPARCQKRGEILRREAIVKKVCNAMVPEVSEMAPVQ